MVGLLRLERTPTTTTSSTTRSARRPPSSTSARCSSTRSRARRASASSTGSSPATRRGSTPARSSTRPGATSTARSSTTDGPPPRRATVPLDRGGPAVRWLRQNAAGLDVTIEDTSERSPPSPSRAPSPGGPRGGDRRVVRRPALLPTPRRPDRRSHRRQPHRLHRRPRLRAVDRGRARGRGWDACRGRGRVRHPAGRMLALDVVRLEAGSDPARGRLHVGPPRRQPGAELLPVEIGLGRLVDSTRRLRRPARARAEQAAGGPPRRLVGLTLDWSGIEALYDAQGLPPAISPAFVARRCRSSRGRPPDRPGDQHGWSPILKKAIALASVPPALRGARTPPAVEWTVEGRRGRVGDSSSCRSSTSPASEPDHRGRRLRRLRPPCRGAARRLDRRSSSSTSRSRPRAATCPASGPRPIGRPSGSGA